MNAINKLAACAIVLLCGQVLFADDAFYGRGVGYTAEKECIENKDNKDGCERCGELYFAKCKSGYSPAGCNICSKSQFRGVGHVSEELCRKENPQGCEQCLALFYPKCKQGYKAESCLVCVPQR